MRAPEDTRGQPPHLRADFWPPRLAEHPVLGKHITEVRTLAERFHESRHDAHEAEVAVQAAALTDKAAFAGALRDGKPRPKPTQAAAEKRRDDKRDEAEAAEVATASAARDAFAAITDHSSAITGEIRSQLDERFATLNGALDVCERVAAEAEEDLRLISWLSQESARGWNHPMKLSGLARPEVPRNDAPLGFEASIGALRQAVEETMAPTPVASPTNVRPLLKRPA